MSLFVPLCLCGSPLQSLSISVAARLRCAFCGDNASVSGDSTPLPQQENAPLIISTRLKPKMLKIRYLVILSMLSVGLMSCAAQHVVNDFDTRQERIPLEVAVRFPGNGDYYSERESRFIGTREKTEILFKKSLAGFFSEVTVIEADAGTDSRYDLQIIIRTESMEATDIGISVEYAVSILSGGHKIADFVVADSGSTPYPVLRFLGQFTTEDAFHLAIDQAARRLFEEIERLEREKRAFSDPRFELEIVLVPAHAQQETLDFDTFRRLVEGLSFALTAETEKGTGIRNKPGNGDKAGAKDTWQLTATFPADRDNAMLLTPAPRLSTATRRVRLLPSDPAWRAVNGGLQRPIATHDTEARFELVVPATLYPSTHAVMEPLGVSHNDPALAPHNGCRFSLRLTDHRQGKAARAMKPLHIPLDYRAHRIHGAERIVLHSPAPFEQPEGLAGAIEANTLQGILSISGATGTDGKPCPKRDAPIRQLRLSGQSLTGQWQPVQEQRFTVRIQPGKQVAGEFQPLAFAEANGCKFTLLLPGHSKRTSLHYQSAPDTGSPILAGTLISEALPARNTLRQARLSIAGDYDKSGLPCRRGRLPLHRVRVAPGGIEARVVFEE
uniref:Uncharacterized protein n=1 Tax=Candidatus Kentrum sp. FM TaxID=2126340 RepID=A0A450TJS5_9GAMM|nr:MAG: hypothetical protein BECKFM1743A_GA0114220_104023 [Candidatus Kentron sp. FM]VFJ67757.1 MAG: hypothetical protein BECKFM1743C_GA0114222_104653 [Candidatus Kentron sp. FM]VFK16832.1 MAG: hypothetical protein BECKFM1743B_GA0114221_104463 [Candidatus Kentron sp. FM]